MMMNDARPARTRYIGGPMVTAMVMAVVLGSVRLLAHDLWIEPTTFAPGAGEIVGTRLRVGQNFVGDPLRRDSSLIDEFVVEDGQGRRPVVGRDGADPAGLVRAAAPGLLVVGYRSNPSVVDETAEKFAQYLQEEGLEAITTLRAQRGQTGGVRERFSRAAKALLLSGSPNRAESDRALGF